MKPTVKRISQIGAALPPRKRHKQLQEKRLNNITKKEQSMLYSYNYSINRYGIRDLTDVYKSCSVFKLRAWAKIKAECEQNHGRCLTVVSYNTNFFTAAYYIEIDETKSILHYHTPYHHYEIVCDIMSK